MPNWLADPTGCASSAKEWACPILRSRDEVMSRSTRVHRTDDDGVTRWSWGHLAVERENKRKTDRGQLRLVVGASGTNHSSSTPGLSPQHATVASDLLRAAAVDMGGQACGGQTILELLWEELDEIMERLMTDQQAEDGRDPGRAEGVAYCIAVMNNPYLPSVDRVREQAMARWEEANA